MVMVKRPKGATGTGVYTLHVPINPSMKSIISVQSISEVLTSIHCAVSVNDVCST